MQYYIPTPTQEDYLKVCEILSDAGYQKLSPKNFEVYEDQTAVSFLFNVLRSPAYCDLDFYQNRCKKYDEEYTLILHKKTLKNFLTTGKLKTKIRLG